MAKKRYINTKFWSDSYVSNLDPIEKLLFLYFLTNPYTNISGIYEINLKQIALDTGIDKQEMLPKIIQRFADHGKIFYYNGWIYIKNFQKHQDITNPKIVKAIENETKLVPKEIIDYISHIDSLSIPYDSLSHLNLNSNSNSNLNLNIISKDITDDKKSSAENKSEKPEKSTYGSPEINFIINTIKKYNHGICDGTEKEQRQYGKHLWGRLKDIKIEGFTWEQTFESLLMVISDNQYHSHKITGPRKIFYELAALMKIAEQDIKKLDASTIKTF